MFQPSSSAALKEIKMKIEAGKTYTFTKSGNAVKAVAPTTRYRGQPMWEVERVSGGSAGKRMDVPASALAAAA